MPNMTPAQAQARKAELLGNGRRGSGDPDFIARYQRGESTARNEVAQLNLAILNPVTSEPIGRDAAAARKEALLRNPEFAAKYLAGDPEARRELNDLQIALTTQE